MALLGAYFDDSRDGGAFALAGYVGLIEEWDNIVAPDWQAALYSMPKSVTEFKTADCRHRFSEFAGWTRDECDELTIKLVDVLADRAKSPSLHGIGAALWFDAVPKELEQEFLVRAYTLCFAAVIMHSWAFAEYICPEGTHELQFVFDHQPGLEGVAQEAFELGMAVARQGYANSRITPRRRIQFEDSAAVTPLQTADLLAYETYKDFKNFLEVPQRRRSRALERLVASRPHLGIAMPEWWVEASKVRRALDLPAHTQPMLTLYNTVPYPEFKLSSASASEPSSSAP